MNTKSLFSKSNLATNQFRRYVAKPETAKDITANVKGLSNKVIIANPPPERVRKTVGNTYKNPQYFSYHKTSYFDAEIEMLKYRLPQPSSLK
ncbi:NADH dehydrogenase [ubiquinone] flavoprotein 3, mitochondrial [Daktulosphaira vitifoliae]|uniref:NADH dehydrogenase [ubiquinone] flavoprotein 3, mitochondrial n=1 Tax=Daktulosphaira vitifoliae TaxID=58002 RepID=UPI0021AAC0E4|nr:NADH dehydrogenase [ubiquinone] flavoprotein 3, mitochondrial [Daktulosphaira vitifoliae]